MVFAISMSSCCDISVSCGRRRRTPLMRRECHLNALNLPEPMSPSIERYNLRMDTEALVAELDAEIDRLQKVKALLTDHTAPLKRGRPSAATKSTATSFGFGTNAKPRRKMSAAGRARIAAAQKA